MRDQQKAKESPYPDYYSGKFDGILKNMILPVAVKRMVRQLDIASEVKNELMSALDESLGQIKENEVGTQDITFIPHLTSSRRLIDTAAEHLIVREMSLFRYPESYGRLANKLRDGKNILLVSNHEAASDALAIYRTLTEANQGFDIHPHIMTIAAHFRSFPLREAFLSGFDRIRVYTDKPRDGHEGRRYKAQSKEARGHNIRAMRSLIRQTQAGGRVIMFFPQGQMHNGSLKEAPKSSAYVLKSIVENSPHGVDAFPIYVKGTEDVFAGLHKMAQGVRRMGRAPVTVKVGESFELESTTHKALLMNKVMDPIASLMPERLRGPYWGN